MYLRDATLAGMNKCHRPAIQDENKFDVSLVTNFTFILPSAIVHPVAITGKVFQSVLSVLLIPLQRMEMLFLIWVKIGAIVSEDLPGFTVIGCNNIIGHPSVVGMKCQDMKCKQIFWSIVAPTLIESFNGQQKSLKSIRK
ncbi:hypothetical protein NE237_029587 [Protea cynaroides]|uniref:Uncharacterized protein n=1 Tax=Protea cynaroides TaxID=273540 RepID=A0A9Q0GSK0_9MAGN|nr:hypothetical protein NE237_029587 [Protea cynaroides]